MPCAVKKRGIVKIMIIPSTRLGIGNAAETLYCKRRQAEQQTDDKLHGQNRLLWRVKAAICMLLFRLRLPRFAPIAGRNHGGIFRLADALPVFVIGYLILPFLQINHLSAIYAPRRIFHYCNFLKSVFTRLMKKASASAKQLISAIGNAYHTSSTPRVIANRNAVGSKIKS